MKKTDVSAVNSLIEWSKSEFSHLPWRIMRTSYKTLVSEIMLQQTTVGTVLNHFDKFIEKYPNIKSLAKATEAQILIDWKGLGYYRRAKNLLKAAQFIHKEFKSEIPLDYSELIKIPGIGDYTASAIVSMNTKNRYLAVDANLERVIARLYLYTDQKGPKLIKKIRDDFSQNLIFENIKNLGDLNEALMDLGRVICQSNKADCSRCPMKKNCVTYREADPLSIPVRDFENDQKSKKFFELKLLRVIVEKNGKILGLKKKKGEWLEGQFEVPTFTLESEDKTNTQYPQLKWPGIEKMISLKTGITKYKITNYILVVSLAEFKKKFNELDYVWENVDHFSTASLKCLKMIQSKKIKNRDKR